MAQILLRRAGLLVSQRQVAIQLLLVYFIVVSALGLIKYGLAVSHVPVYHLALPTLALFQGT